MSTDLLQIFPVEAHTRTPHSEDESDLVDIVAVHGLNENLLEAWTDPETGILWLRDLLPRSIKVARVLTFGYEATASSFFGDGCATQIQMHAQTLVARLEADRSLERCDYRPIVFVCHGLGGILVKEALVYSFSRTSAKTVHIHNIYVSTYAILFFGTPHSSINKQIWLQVESLQLSRSNLTAPYEDLARVDSENDLLALRLVTDQFNQLVKQFRIFFFWEEKQTELGPCSGFVVGQSSAAPEISETERSGIPSTHSKMIKFSSTNSSSYRMVIAAIARYCHEAPTRINFRWQQARKALAEQHSSEVSELLGLNFNVHDNQKLDYAPIPPQRRFNRYFFPPRERTADFVGREDVSQLLEDCLSLSESNRSSRQQGVFVIYGMGGSGKTEFCCKFAKDHQNKFWGVFTIHATSPKTASDSFAKIGKLGGLEATADAGKHWLEQLQEPFLLIIDNADNPELDVPSLFPAGGQCCILVTTRNPAVRRHQTIGSVELRGLKQEEALHLLLRRADIPRPWDISLENTGNEITKALGYLALALKQAGTAIFRKICDLKDYLNFHIHYRNHWQADPELRNTLKDGEEEVYSSFDISLRYFDHKDSIVSKDAVEILNIIAFYHFEHIRVDIFTRAMENRLKQVSLETKGSFSVVSRFLKLIVGRLRPPEILPRFLKGEPSEQSPWRITKALAELYSLSLISYDGKDASFSLHPLVHAWARDRLRPEERAIWAEIALNTLVESIVLPPDSSGEEHENFRRDLLPHLDSCLAATPIRADTFNSQTGSFQISLTFFFQPTLLFIFREQALKAAKCGYVYVERGRFHEAAKHLSMTKEILTQTLGPDHEKTCAAMLGLAHTYWGLGRLEEAIALQSCVVKAREKALGPDHHQTLQAMDQLGRSHWLHGEYKEALELQQQTTERMKTSLGLEDERALAALDNLGVTLGSWHRFEESLHIHQQVLLAREKTLGPRNLETLTTMQNLAMVLFDLDQPGPAQTLMIQVYEERKLKLGKEHPWTLWALCNLAKIKVRLGLLDEAANMLIGGIEAGKRSLSANHLGVLMGRGELARVYSRQGRYEEAETICIDTVERIEKSRGTEHPDCVYSLWKLAQLYARQGKLEKAIEACNLALERAQKKLTPEHPIYGKIQSELRQFRSAMENGTLLRP